MILKNAYLFWTLQDLWAWKLFPWMPCSKNSILLINGKLVWNWGIAFPVNYWLLIWTYFCSFPLWIYAVFCIFLDFHGNSLCWLTSSPGDIVEMNHIKQSPILRCLKSGDASKQESIPSALNFRNFPICSWSMNSLSMIFLLSSRN